MQRYQQTAHKLGSEAFITIVVDDPADPAPIFGELWAQVDTFEQRFSRFRPDSELSMFNKSAGREAEISPAFRALLVAAKAQAEATGGLYNPFILPALQRAGYKGSWPQPSELGTTPTYEAGALHDWRSLRIGATTASMPSDAALDFGGIGKGYLLDQLADSLSKLQVAGYWASLGGDIICDGSDFSGESWRLDIQSATVAGGAVATIPNNGGRLALATSGTLKRRGINGQNKPWHHLIHPQTGKPAQTDVATASVACMSATEADVLAKVCVLLGNKQALKQAETWNILDVVLQTVQADGSLAVTQKGALWLPA